MEQPYNTKAILDYSEGRLEITIPTADYSFDTIFLGIWLCGWAFGEFMAILSITGKLRADSAPMSPMSLLWCIGWTAAGLSMLRTLLWKVKGKEIIIFTRSSLIVKKKNLLFHEDQVYELSESYNFRVAKQRPRSAFHVKRGFRSLIKEGKICFDYGSGQQHSIAGEIDEAEARYLLLLLQEKKLLSKEHIQGVL